EIDVLVGQPWLERAVDEQSPDLLERHVADEVLDVDAAIAELPSLLVGLGDLRLEGDDTGEAGREVVAAHARISSSSISWPRPRSRAAFRTSAAAARSWTATPTDLYSVICSPELRPTEVPAMTSPSSTTPSRPRGSSSGAPAGSGANAESRCSTTTTSARSTIAGSSSEPPPMLEPTELTCVPGLSHSYRTIGSCAAVVACTTSAPRTA